ncbi:hypothetical protein CAAN1_04S00188 [[Candida] anglica]|uniref:CCR4-NOT transcription complex subunit 11 n=1 Tax=[Candida] anglica TaxID=148631 RepID=A0ABP0E999_9ASCO
MTPQSVIRRRLAVSVVRSRVGRVCGGVSFPNTTMMTPRHHPSRMIGGSTRGLYMGATVSSTDCAGQYMEIIEGKVPVPEVEIFLYNLLMNGNLDAATALLYKIGVEVPDDGQTVSDDTCLANITLSDQIWSFYLSQICDASHYSGATLVYHRIINPPTDSMYLPSDHVPFLVSAESLVYLAIIFSRNSDATKVRGCIDYFKRFYSSLGHRHIYKDLRMLLVEAHSRAGQFERALAEFTVLAHVFKSKTDSLWYSRSKMFVFDNFRWRRTATKLNIHKKGTTSSEPLDVSEASVAASMGTKLFVPTTERNIYSSPNKPVYPLIAGTVHVADLPHFYRLVRANVDRLMAQESTPLEEKLQTLLGFVRTSHPLLQIFVFKSLCDGGHLQQAFLFLIKLEQMDQDKFLLQSANFRYFFQSCRAKLESTVATITTTGPTSATTETLSSTLLLCTSMMQLREWNIVGATFPRVLAEYIQAVMASPGATQAHIQPYMDQIVLGGSKAALLEIRLDSESYSKFNAMFGNQYSSAVKEAK